jgi:hypothetical protein
LGEVSRANLKRRPPPGQIRCKGGRFAELLRSILIGVHRHRRIIIAEISVQA